MARQTSETIIERKTRLDGSVSEYRCERLSLEVDRHAVLRYVMDRDWVIGDTGIVLHPGQITIAHYWSDRPYNVYHWMDTAGKTLGYYFNIADQTRIEPGRLSWRDLVVDVLVLPGAPPRVLDEDELPANLPAELRATIDAGVAAVVGGGDNLIDEIAAASRRLAPRVFPDAA